MTTCKSDSKDYRNNGLITKIWGSPGWIFNHSVTFGYPVNPTESQKRDYRDYFTALGKVLPCRFCRDSYQKFLVTDRTALTDDVLKNRDSLTKWFYNIHEAVNNKLEMDYGVTYEDVVRRYESFRAKCSKNELIYRGCYEPLDYKAFSFRNLNQVDCPIVMLEVAKPFIELAIIRNLDTKYFIFLPTVYKYSGDFNKLKQQSSWRDRNKFCEKQIKMMREMSIPSIETTGSWKGLPTMNELKLLVFLSSNLNRTEINECREKLMVHPEYLSRIDEKN